MEASGPRFERRPDEADINDDSLGKLVNEVSEHASTLIREEIELAKAEVEQKVKRLAMGGVVAAVAGFFVLIATIFLFETIAWAFTDFVFGNDNPWAGYLATTILLLLLAALGGYIAYRSFQAGAPPVPDQAIEEAKLIREALEHPDVQAAQAQAAAAPAQPAPTPAATPAAPVATEAPRPAQAEKAAAQAEKKQAKQAAKAAKQAEKQAAKQARQDEKEAAQARKEAEQARKEAAKRSDLAEKEAGKQAEKARKEAEKQAKKDAKNKKDGES